MCSIVFNYKFIVENKIIFDEDTYYSEDREFIVKSLYYAKSVRIVKEVLFFYLANPTSAMNIAQYTIKRFTSILAMERVYNLLQRNNILKNAALVNLKLTIILHQSLFYKYTSTDSSLAEKLKDYSNKYLSQKTSLKLDKYSLFVFVFSYLFKVKPVYNLIIKFL